MAIDQSPIIRDDYRDYVEFCFKEFGDRVKYWITINKPNYFVVGGYKTGTKAPGQCSKYIGNCTFGNLGIEPYIVGHNLLLSHATAIKLYREKYQVYDLNNNIANQFEDYVPSTCVSLINQYPYIYMCIQNINVFQAPN